VATNRWRKVWDHFKGRGAYPHQLAFLLLIPLRSLIFSPRELVARLHLTANSRVLELGPGPGFFSVDIARRIPSGHLCLVDLQREMLDKARARIRRAGVPNVSFTQASASALPFAREVFDAAYLVTVLGEVPDAAACVVQLRDVLRRGGLLSITELAGDPDAMTEGGIATLAKAANLEHSETFTKRFGFTINFRKA
jgi:ubiquinone/menaquinone biosynthesis C-methylase UbiE